MQSKVALLVVFLSLVPSAYAQDFEVLWTESAGNPTVVSSVDFDEDGNPDGAVIGTLPKVTAFGAWGGRWEYPVGDARSIAAADLDRNGYANEVVVAASKVYALDQGGAKKWAYGAIGHVVIALDLDGDGYRDEVVFGGDNGVYALDSDGTPLWNLTTGERVTRLAAVDGGVIAGSTTYVRKVSTTGNLHWKVKLSGNIGGLAPLDFDENGKPEGVAAASLDGNVTAFSAFGVKVWPGYSRPSFEGKILTAPLDLNSDGYANEVAISMGPLYAFDSAGSRLWQVTSGVYDANGIDALDLDGDGKLDDVVVGTNDKIYVFDAKGKRVGTYDQGADFLVAVDLDGDGKISEIIAESETDLKVRGIKISIQDNTTSPAPPPTTPPPQTVAPPQTTLPPETPTPQEAEELSVDAGQDTTVDEGVTVVLQADVNLTTPESRIVAYLWTENTTLLNRNTTQSSIAWIFSPGIHTIKLWVIDDRGDAASDEVTVTVETAPELNVTMDSDKDGLTDMQEGVLGSDPNNPDTDGDGLIDSKDPNPLVPGKAEKGSWDVLKWAVPVILLAVIIVGVILKGKIQDFLWHRDWLK